ncbi:MAG: ComF family protein [Rhodocyclaceae bacterium]|jgi:ComF family protein|nr:ComF family protein [Rhodocyclaceae bacterium]
MSHGLVRQFATWFNATLGQPLAGILLAQSCALCHLPSGNHPVCASCTQDLPVLPDARCERCALPMLGGLTHCPDCSRHLPLFDTAYAAWAYDFPVDTLIRDFKYGHHLYLGRFFAEQLTSVLEQTWGASGQPRPDLIVPMPLHPHRLRTRGFNQAAEIARHMARRLRIPCAYDALVRLHDTSPQAGLHRDERWRNLLGAFACPEGLPAKHILLVDDVLTTGASLSACAEALRHSGASRIDVAVVARTPTSDSLESITNF